LAGDDKTHIRVLLVDTSHTLQQSGLLFVLVRDKQVGVDIALVDFKARLIGKAIPVTQAGLGQRGGTGHVMEGQFVIYSVVFASVPFACRWKIGRLQAPGPLLGWRLWGRSGGERDCA